MAIHFDRLLKLADFLDALPPKRFHYNHWVGDDWGGAADFSCGTTACALGWATTMPEFRELGLRMGRCGCTPNCKVPSVQLGNLSDLGAAQDLFGLENEEARFLFIPKRALDGIVGPDEDASALEVSAHIRRFVEERRK